MCGGGGMGAVCCCEGRLCVWGGDGGLCVVVRGDCVCGGGGWGAVCCLKGDCVCGGGMGGCVLL